MKKVRQYHTASSRIGRGDFYGTGIRAKIGRPVENMMLETTKIRRKKPPKTLA